MPEIELSVMIHTPQTVEVLTGLLKEFTAQTGIHVNLTTLKWDNAHGELNRTALYHHGPDVSEIGSTWVNDLIAMNALRPFAQNEINLIGRPEEFVAEAWNSGRLQGDPTQWAIPWLAETYLIHYREDMLEKAGIDSATAFTSHEQLAKTVQRLVESGVDVPIELPLGLDRFGTLHVLASWIWSVGGDFCEADGKRVAFNQPRALAAIRAYFNLLRSLPVEARQKIRARDRGLFERGKSAINFGTLMFYANHQSAPQEAKDNWRVTPLPGDHFIGGSNLVVWKHTRNDRAAIELVRYLTSPTVQVRVAPALATMPPRLAALDLPQIANDPVLRVFGQSIRTGRTYPSIPLWGLIEDRLLVALVQIGDAILADDTANLDQVIKQYLDPLARKLNITLSQ